VEGDTSSVLVAASAFLASTTGWILYPAQRIYQRGNDQCQFPDRSEQVLVGNRPPCSAWRIKPERVITNRAPLADGLGAYEKFDKREAGTLKRGC